MKKLLILSIAALIGSAAMLSSCGKYEEGPKFALSSKKSRLIGEWKTTSVNEDGVEWNLTNLTITQSIKDDGTYSANTSYVILGQTFNDASSGTWEFSDDKSAVLLKEPSIATDTLVIVKLAKDQLKFKQFDYSSGALMRFTMDAQ